MVGAPFERGFRGDLSSRTFFDSDLYDRGGPFSASKTPADNRIALQYSLSEMLRGGVTTILELGAVDALSNETVDLPVTQTILQRLDKFHENGTTVLITLSAHSKQVSDKLPTRTGGGSYLEPVG